VLLALGEEHTAVWQALDEEEIKESPRPWPAWARLGQVVEELLVEFVSGMSDRRDHGLLRTDPALLASFMPPRRSTP
jgi:flagellar motor switch protein FliG